MGMGIFLGEIWGFLREKKKREKGNKRWERPIPRIGNSFPKIPIFLEFPHPRGGKSPKKNPPEKIGIGNFTSIWEISEEIFTTFFSWILEKKEGKISDVPEGFGILRSAPIPENVGENLGRIWGFSMEF